MTHAEKQWTFDKLRSFRGLFKAKVSTPIDEPKDKQAWLEGMEELGVGPEGVMIVGDSVTSDVIPALQLGVKKVIWISNGRKWEELPLSDIYLYPEKPNEVVMVESIDQLSEALLAV